jgi:effector-binding domain-containing protein
MDHDVRIEHADPLPMAAERFVARPDQLGRAIPDACGRVWKFVKTAGIPDPGQHVAVYLDGQILVECGVLLPGPFPESGTVVRSATPAGRIATTTHFGAYGRLGDAHRAIVDACSAQGHRLAGPNWEIYGHWEDDWNNDPSKIRTDVFYLLEG